MELYGDISGGTVHHVEIRDDRVDAELLGPINSLVTSEETRGDSAANRVSAPFTVHLDPDRAAVLIRIGGRALVLEQGEYSDWVKVEFTLLPVIGRVSGVVRFLLKQVRPHFQLYATAVNIDPANQAVPVTYPKELGAEIARDIGAFWTKGLPSDTKALDYGIIDDEQYVAQAELILEEHLALFRHQWSRFEDGLFYFYVSSTDQDTHMLWRNMDETHRCAGPALRGGSILREDGGLRGPPAVDDHMLLVCHLASPRSLASSTSTPGCGTAGTWRSRTAPARRRRRMSPTSTGAGPSPTGSGSTGSISTSRAARGTAS
jgi:hypothetical protein